MDKNVRKQSMQENIFKYITFGADGFALLYIAMIIIQLCKFFYQGN